MVISKSSLLQENFCSGTLIPSSAKEDICFFEEMNLALIDMKRELADTKKVMYKSVLEATDMVAVNESFSGFIDTVKKIIDKFLDMIKKIFSQFITLLNKAVKSDKYIKKHKDALKHYGEDEKDMFKMSIYRFTHLEPESNIPKVEVESLTKWTGGDSQTAAFNPFNYDATKDAGKSLYDAVKARYDAYSDKNDSSSYDTYRGDVIGANRAISASDYSSELFEIFRNGESSKTEEGIGSDIINDALRRFLDYEKTVSAVERKKKEIDRKYTDIKRAMKNWADANEDTSGHTALRLIFGTTDTTHGVTNLDAFTANGAPLTDEEKSKINGITKSFTQAMISRIEQYATIHGTAFSAKLDAIKDCMTQDKKILYGALSKVAKHKGGLKESAVEGELESIPVYVDTLAALTCSDSDIIGDDTNYEGSEWNW